MSEQGNSQNHQKSISPLRLRLSRDFAVAISGTSMLTIMNYAIDVIHETPFEALANPDYILAGTGVTMFTLFLTHLAARYDDELKAIERARNQYQPVSHHQL